MTELDDDVPRPHAASATSLLVGRRRALAAAAAALAIAGVSLVSIALTSRHHAPRPSPAAQAAPLPSDRPTPGPRQPTHAPTTKPHLVPKPTITSKPDLPPLQTGLTMASSPPVRLSIPSIGVNTGIMNLGLNTDGTVQTPPLGRNSIAGWYELSPTPGVQGASVILGHVDSAAYGAGVFYRLGALNPGDQVNIQRQDGTTAVFRIDRVAEYPKTQFPTSLVYAPTSYPALRLVTCGGAFDTTTHNYRDNIIAFASLATSHPA